MPRRRAPSNRPLEPRTVVLRSDLVVPPPPPPPPANLADAMADDQPQQPPQQPQPGHDSLPGPGLFYGKDNEDGTDWLRNYDLWAEYRNLGDVPRLAALGLHFRGAAATWHSVLPANQKDTIAHLRESFTARYGLNARAQWQRARSVWTMTQASTENVQDFIARILRASVDAGLPDGQQRQVLISGLKPAIRQHVLRGEYATVDAIRQAAIIAEQSDAAGPQDEVVAAVRRLEDQLQRMTLSAVVPRTPSPAPRPEDRQSPYRSTSEYSNRSRGTSSYQRGGRRPYGDRPSHPTRSPSMERRRVHFEPSQYAANNNNSSSYSDRRPCDSCGGAHPRSTCRFRWVLCRACNKEGHIERVCRASRR